jgi:ribosomal protein S25
MAFNKLTAKPEHLDAILRSLPSDKLVTPFELVKITGLSLTATYGAIQELENRGAIDVIKQNATPKMQVRLKNSSL